MKKNLFMLTLMTLLFSCKNEKIKAYEQENILKTDTLNIEHIKIETH